MSTLHSPLDVTGGSRAGGRTLGGPMLPGFVVGAAFVGLAALFVAGSALSDPGGWAAVGMTAAWLVPLVALVVLAFWRPRQAVPVLVVAALLPLAFGAWSLVDPTAARDWENRVGPVGLVVLLVVSAGLVTLGLSRPVLAGAVLLVVTVVPPLLAALAPGTGRGEPLSLALLTLPLVVAAVLYLVAGTRARGRHPHR